MFIAVSERGEVEIHEGYVTREEARKAEKKEQGEATQVKPAKPELSGPAQNYVELHRLGCRLTSSSRSRPTPNRVVSLLPIVGKP